MQLVRHFLEQIRCSWPLILSYYKFTNYIYSGCTYIIKCRFGNSSYLAETEIFFIESTVDKVKK